MNTRPWVVSGIVLMLMATAVAAQQQTQPQASSSQSYLGFDKNDYPGDQNLSALRRSFSYAGFWLSNPPGMTTDPWAGKRTTIRAAGFGFLLLFNGRLDAALKVRDATAMGREDGRAAVAAARREGFPAGAVIFLDQEEGGGLLEEQAAYLGAWIAAVDHSTYKTGVYCSGIAVAAGSKQVSTAQDIAARFPTAKLWVWNDVCPPSPGCLPARALDPKRSGTGQAWVWQFARSPRSNEGTDRCRATYAPDNGCYAPGLPHSPETFVDLDVSRSVDPSQGR